MSATATHLTATTVAFDFLNTDQLEHWDNDTETNTTGTMEPPIQGPFQPLYPKLSIAEYLLIRRVLRLYVNPFLCAFGISTNIASMFVLRKDGLNKSSNILLLALALADLQYVAFKMDIPGAIFYFEGSGSGFHFQYNTAKFWYVLWMINYYLYTVGQFCSLTFPLLITGERIVAIFLPLHFASIVTTKRTFLACLVVFVCFFIRFIPLFFELGLIEVTPNLYFMRRSDILPERLYYHYVLQITNWITGVGYLVCVIIGTIIIGVKVAFVAQQRLKMSASTETKDKKRTTRTTMTLLSVCVLYCTTNLIICALGFVITGGPTPYFSLLYDITDEIGIINSSCNFFIYIFYNKKFRNHLSIRKSTRSQARMENKKS